jgi:hypothetical protein
MSEQEPTETAEPTQSRGITHFRASDMLETARLPVITLRTRRLAMSVTKKQWTFLTPESRVAAIAVLRDIERHEPHRHGLPNRTNIRPVLMAIKNENRRTTAQAMIEHTINRVATQLEKIPLPPGSKDRHFDFERVINENVLAFWVVWCSNSREKWRRVWCLI